MKTINIDINCDVGEGIGNENELFPFISSCNIACGGHAGDDASMSQITKMAKHHNVLVGAHPSYPDKDNFGRRSIDIEPDVLIKSIQSQIKNLENILKIEGVPMHHIKPHGALYNDLAINQELAQTFLEGIKKYKTSNVLYVPPNSVISEEAAKQGFTIKHEAFADRNYNADLSLVSREKPNAVINDPHEVLKHLTKMIREQSVITMNGEIVKIKADTYCLHGDTPNALQILMYLSKELPKQNIQIKK